ncbi:hypothetical protein ACFPRL_04960 [Pseudoclavibacter helvolus]
MEELTPNGWLMTPTCPLSMSPPPNETDAPTSLCRAHTAQTSPATPRSAPTRSGPTSTPTW